MTRKPPTWAISMMLAANVALACGPTYVPRYGSVPYIDLGHGAERNFLMLLDSYHSPPQPAAYADSETLQRRYEGQVRTLIAQSGRSGLTVFDSRRPQERFCPDNTRENCPIAIPVHFRSGYSVSWCTNESKDAALQFTQSVLASNATDRKVANLVEARHLLLRAGCSKMKQDTLDRFDALTQSGDFTAAAADHAAYLGATKAFYEKDYAVALAGFERLHKSGEPWIAETSLYLSGRIPLLQSQERWNGYSAPGEEIDQERIDAAAQGFDRYLATYPRGRYAASADGLRRKIAYLGGDRETLKTKLDDNVNAAADAFIATPNDETREHFTRLFAEWQRHAGGDVDYGTVSPLVIAYDVMRKIENGENRQQTLNALQGAQSRFAGMERVYHLLHSMALLVSGDHERILAGPAPTVFEDGVDVAIAALHAQASEAAGRVAQARTTWLAIHESSDERKAWDTVQARIAQTYLLENDYRGLARESSHVTLKKVFEDAFATACDENVLIDIAAVNESLNPNAGSAARDEVFRRRIVRGDYDGLHALYEKVADPGDFSLIETAARMTADDPDDARGLLNLGYYMLKKMSPQRSSLPTMNDEEGTAGSCPATHNSHMARYMGPWDYFYRVVELHDDGHKSVDEAKALHYLVLCDKPGYRSAECDWNSSSGRDRPSGKELFQRLHEKYPDSKWAKETPYYYD